MLINEIIGEVIFDFYKIFVIFLEHIMTIKNNMI